MKWPGRFNTPTLGALYLSADPWTAVRELREGNGRHVDDCVISVISLTVARVVDLVDPATAREWGLSDGDLSSEDISFCQKIAARAAEEGVEALCWPSATGAGESMAVFLDRMAPGSRLMLVRAFELPELSNEARLKDRLDRLAPTRVLIDEASKGETDDQTGT